MDSLDELGGEEEAISIMAKHCKASETEMTGRELECRYLSQFNGEKWSGTKADCLKILTIKRQK